jgi:D-alanine-D-alanine ligase
VGGIASPVVVLYGAVPAQAPPDEKDVLVEVQTVTEALTQLGHRVEPMALTLDLEAARSRLAHLRPRLVFNLVESVAGSGRLLHLAPALLEELALPYTGTPLAGLFLSSNKLLAKRLLAMAGIPTPLWQGPEISAREAGSAAGPWIIKSVWEHASIGIDDDSLVNGVEALASALQERRSRLLRLFKNDAHALAATGLESAILRDANLTFP